MGKFIIKETKTGVVFNLVAANGETRFHLKARNGQIVAVSQAYKEKAGEEKGIKSVRKSAPAAVVEDEKAE